MTKRRKLRIYGPQAVVFCVTLVCMVAAPVAFFALVPESIVDKIFRLPWTTIVSVMTPLFVAAAGIVRQAFMGSITDEDEDEDD